MTSQIAHTTFQQDMTPITDAVGTHQCLKQTVVQANAPEKTSCSITVFFQKNDFGNKDKTKGVLFQTTSQPVRKTSQQNVIPIMNAVGTDQCLKQTLHTNAVIDPLSGASLEYRALSRGPNAPIWVTALANDLGRLAQGVGTRMPKGNNTIYFIPPRSRSVHQKGHVRSPSDIHPLPQI